MRMRRPSTLLPLALLSGAALLPGSPPARAQAPSPAPALSVELLEALKLRPIGPATMSGRVVDVAVNEKDPHVIYVATATGGLWKTSDNAVTLRPVFENQAVHSIGAIALSASDPEIVWLGSGERANRQSSSWGDGVYKSTDGGGTWTNMGLRDSHHVGRIAIHPRDPDVVFVAAMGHLWGPNEERGLYRTADGGRSWQRVLYVDADTGAVDVAIDPATPEVVYAATHQRRRTAFGYHGGGPGAGLHKSTDGGRTWRRLARGLPAGDYGRIGISIFRKDPRIVYACVEQGLRYNASTEYDVYQAGVYRSEDRGESWRQMSTWNPRPTYASQILVDPSDDQRVYMMNNYSYSDDGGRTFKDAEQSLHGDDRMVWVNPKDSRHVIKADDGGLGISYDRGLRWLYHTALPVAQYYRVALDMQRPFWVYGGLQDNGSWAGPSATPYAWGILNEDWIRTGGGDGFWSVPEPDGRTVYVNSQYLGLTRFDMRTRESKSIRPSSREGEAPKLGNWGAPKPRVGQYTAPANWDAPFLISPHDPRTLYAGMRVLWKSSDRGESWTSLGDRTTGVDRRGLRIMGQLPGPATHSLDDGVPYYPTISALAESPLRAGLLWVGGDDGSLQVSRDGGKSWSDVAAQLPGLPRSSYIAGIEASRHREASVLVAVDNHRSDDYENYLYRSDDFGRTFRSIVGDLPPRRVIRAVHEDPRNAGLLYVATEFGFFFSPDGGRRWLELRNNLPRVAINDFAIHPRDNDLVLASHGRGLWILDNLAPLQELTAEVLAAPAHLFSVEAAEMVRKSNPKAHAGDMVFKGENPPDGAILDYYLRDAAAAVTLTVHDSEGRQVAALEPTRARGVNRVVWDLRHPKLPPQEFRYMNSGRPPRAPLGPFVAPGQYLARLTVAGHAYERRFAVEDDRRLDVAPDERRAWLEAALEIHATYREASELLERARPAAQGAAATAAARELHLTLVELQARIGSLYAAVNAVTARPTADQRAQAEYFKVRVGELRAGTPAASR